MRIGLVVEQALAPVPGGTGRYSREVAAALARRAPAGCELVGVTAFHLDVRAAAVAGVAGPRRLALGRRALAMAWERGVGPGVPGDVVHALTPLAPPRRRTPLVVTVHDAVPWTHPETLTARGVRWHRAAVRRAAQTADLVVVPTNAVAEQLHAHVGLGADRVRIVGEGVSTALALPADADARAARLRLGAPYLLTVATLEPRKGLDRLLATLAAQGAPQLPLLVVGQQGWGGVDLGAEAARLGLADRVRVLGHLPDADLAVVLNRATALVVPSRAEGFGLPLLEGMAAGTPVVTSDDPALVEVGGGAAVVAGAADLGERLRQVVEDPGLRELMIVRGRARAAQFTWDAAADSLLAAYADLRAAAA